MPIQYAGTRVVGTFAANSRAAVVEGIRTVLMSAGWTDVGGTGTGDRRLESVATTGPSLKYRVYLRDPGSGATARVQVHNTASTQVSQDFYLSTASNKAYRLIATPHQFFVLNTNTTTALLADDFFASGVPYLETFLYDTSALGKLAISECIWAQGNLNASGTSTTNLSFRDRCSLETSCYSWQSLNNTAWAGTGAGGVGVQRLVTMYSMNPNTAKGGFIYGNGYMLRLPARICWSWAVDDPRSRIRGQLWDALVIQGTTTATTKSINSFGWEPITVLNTSEYGHPHLWVRTS